MPQNGREKEIRVNRLKQTICHHCQATIDTTGRQPLQWRKCPDCRKPYQVHWQLGHYTLESHLAAGATGLVCAAFDTILHRHVAIKLPYATHDEQDRRYQQAVTEARMQASISHQHVCRVYAMASDLGQPYITMELIDGGNIREKILADQRLDAAAVVRIGCEAAEGLRAMHRMGVIHLDVKPANLLLDRRGQIKLIDFGLAQRLSQPRHHSPVGSPYYIAPEVAREQPIDHRADIYSLGATLFHALVGRPPFDVPDGTTRDVIRARFVDVPPDIRELRPDTPPALASLIRMMLALEPERRPADYDHLLRHFATIPLDAAPPLRPIVRNAQPPAPSDTPTAGERTHVLGGLGP